MSIQKRTNIHAELTPDLSPRKTHFKDLPFSYQYEALCRLLTTYWLLHLRALTQGMKRGKALSPRLFSPPGTAPTWCGSESFWETALITSKHGLILQRISPSSSAYPPWQAALKLPIAGTALWLTWEQWNSSARKVLSAIQMHGQFVSLCSYTTLSFISFSSDMCITGFIQEAFLSQPV